MKKILPEYAFSAEQFNKIAQLAKQTGLTENVTRILYARGIDTSEKINQFMNPSKANFLSPFLMSGMKAAVRLITEARDEGKTVAVLPCGADSVVPLSHKRLASAILEQDGCLLSEYLPGVPAEKFRFPQRNRIIAALSPVTVVAAAPEKSGALITAEFALEQGRDVYLLAAGLAESCCNQGMEAYRQDGAPVINSVAEYEACIAALPGCTLEIVQDGGKASVGRISAETRYCRQEKQLLF